MHIVMPTSVKGGLILTALLAFIAGLAAVIIDVAERLEMPNKAVLGDVLPEAIIVLCSFILIFCVTLLKTDNKISNLIDETLESIASGIIYFDKQGDLVRFNSIAGILLPELTEAITSQDFIGTYRKFLAFIYDRSMDIRDHSKLSLDAMHLSSSKLLFREIIKLQNGKIILIQFYQRRPGDIISILTDISLLKTHIEEVAALTEENRIMIKAIESTGNGMLIAQDNGEFIHVTFASGAFSNILGSSGEEIIGTKFPDILELPFSDQMDLIKQGLAKARREANIGEIILKLHQDKTILWFTLYILFFCDEKDQGFYVCFLSNQNEAREAQAKLLQNKKMESIARMATNMAHDFNNILSVIDGYSNIIRKNLKSGKDVTELFGPIDRSVKRGSDLSSLLMAISEGQGAQKRPININDHIRNIEPEIASMMPDNIAMVVSVPDEPYYIEASPDAMTQILRNLAANSRESMQKTGGGFYRLYFRHQGPKRPCMYTGH